MSTITYTNEAGVKVRREINHAIDIREFTGTAVYPWLVMAANQRLTNEDVAMWLEHVAIENPAVRRPFGWVKKRRHLTRLYRPAPRPHDDGKDAEAFEIMSAHSTLSLSGLSVLLRERGILRSRDWVRRWRGLRPHCALAAHKECEC